MPCDAFKAALKLKGEQTTNHSSACQKAAPLNSNDITGAGETLKIQVRF